MLRVAALELRRIPITHGREPRIHGRVPLANA